MRRLERLRLEFPFAGSRMLRGLLAAEGCKIGRRHVKTLMRRMGDRGALSPSAHEQARARGAALGRHGSSSYPVLSEGTILSHAPRHNMPAAHFQSSARFNARPNPALATDDLSLQFNSGNHGEDDCEQDGAAPYEGHHWPVFRLKQVSHVYRDRYQMEGRRL
jgi:hypothetical protein